MELRVSVSEIRMEGMCKIMTTRTMGQIMTIRTILDANGVRWTEMDAVGRKQIIEFLTRKWEREQSYRLIKEIWAFHENRIAVRFAYEWQDASGNWFRSYGNENWEFDALGLMQVRYASINDLSIDEAERKFHWPQGRRPDDHPGLSDLGL